MSLGISIAERRILLLKISLNGFCSLQEMFPSSVNLFSRLVVFLHLHHSGLKTENFTATKELFLQNPSISFWRFEVIYSFVSSRSSSSLNFLMNPPPRNGSCSIQPENGTTTTTTFIVSCEDWFDEDGIKDYSLQISSSIFRSVWSSDHSFQTFIAYSQVSIFEVYLSPARDQNPLDLFVEIRDGRDCLVKWTNLSSITVQSDSILLDVMINNIVNRSTTTMSMNPFIQLLTKRNQNEVGQLINSLSEQITAKNEDNLRMGTSSLFDSSSSIVDLEILSFL